MDILKLGAFELAAKIKSRELKPTEVTEAFIQQAEKTQGLTNAMVETFFDQARAEAKEKDKILEGSTTELPPLFGVPFSVKEMLSIEGVKRTAGNIHFRDAIAKETTSVVHRLRKAGGIFLGTTNVPELGFWFETDNVVYGRTNNPHHPSRTSGGSSGGEAALIAARGSAFGVGSDIGGSIRVPAFFCGIFGHKPSPRMVPLTGHFPFTDEEVRTFKDPHYPYTTIGPMTYKAQDLYGLLKIFKGPDNIDPGIIDIPLKPLVEDVTQIKIYTLPSPKIFLARRVQEEMVSTVQQVTKYLENIGCQILPFPEDFFNNAVQLWFNALKRSKSGSFAQALSPHHPFNLKKELMNFFTLRANHTFPSLGTALLETFASAGIEEEKKSEELFQELLDLRQQMQVFLKDNAVLLLPPHPRTAPPHRAPFFSPFDFIYAGIFNVLEVCATVCPIGFDKDSLPTGVQIVAGQGEDHLAISVAVALESAFGGSSIPAALTNPR